MGGMSDNAQTELLAPPQFIMTGAGAADACFNIPDIIILIATFIGISDIVTMSYFARTNRCTHNSLDRDRSRIISCLERNTPSLSLFLERLLLRYDRLPCHSLEVRLRFRTFEFDSVDDLLIF